SSKYEKVAKIGQGTFGEVFKAREKGNNRKFVAMKKVLMENEKEGFPITALREIRILQLLKHENVVNLLEICRTKANKNNNYRSTFYLVFDFCEHDLAGLLSNMNVKFSLGEVKKVLQQLLNGLYYIHSNKILHRDMKAANVLITKNGILKLADFGLARAISLSKPAGVPNRYTNRVVTLWYRPPELLLGDRNYGPPVDIKYEKVAKIGQGTFGEVFKAREIGNNGKFVAMKKVLMENQKEGFPITSLREYQILQLLKHENIILHRDLKTANILMTKNGVLKIADFGLARALILEETRLAKKELKIHYCLISVQRILCSAIVENILIMASGMGDEQPTTSGVQQPSKTMSKQQMREKYLETCEFPFIGESSKYEKVAKIGQGTFGEVFKAREIGNNGKFVAMKKVLMENQKEGFPITSLREYRILQLLKHENIVTLIEMCRTRPNQNNLTTFYMVFEFCEHDLAGLLSNMNVKFSLGEVKKVLQQLLSGLYFIHANKILHRDLKTANILMTKNGVLKIADFGLARALSAERPKGPPIRYTNPVVTLWYRPPELLLGDRNYGPPVDMWGAGCIMAEMWTRSPIMQGNTEQQQIVFISQLCGSFTPDVWPGIVDLKLYNKMELPMGHNRKVKDRLKVYVQNAFGCDLLDKLLQLDPEARLDADSALNHEFFWTDPMPSDLGKMMSKYHSSMFEYFAPPPKRANQRKRQMESNQTQNKTQDNSYQDRVY
ncbi:Cyclin-dependent kinase 9, partial [Pseudolycoriella hygida]